MGGRQSRSCLPLLERCFKRRHPWWEELHVVDHSGHFGAGDGDSDEEVDLEAASRQREALSYRNMGRSFHVAGSFDKAVEYYDKELELRTALGDTVGACEVWLELGTALRARGDADAALSAFESCVSLVCEAREPQLAYQALCQLASTHRYRGDVDRAIGCVEKCLALAESLDDKQGIALAYNHLGNIHQAQGNYQTALQFHLKGVLSAREGGEDGDTPGEESTAAQGREPSAAAPSLGAFIEP